MTDQDHYAQQYSKTEARLAEIEARLPDSEGKEYEELLDEYRFLDLYLDQLMTQLAF